MKLIGLKLKNFRCYKEEIYLSVDSFTAIVGCNDAGKSSILDAIDIFLNDSTIDSGDANLNGDREDVCITLLFSNLPNEIILDVDHPTTLQDEYLINPDGYLEIKKRYDCSSNKSKPAGVYLYANHPVNEKISNLHSLTNQKLKTLLKDLDLPTTGIDQTINTQIRKKIWQNFPSLELLPRYIQIDKDAKNIWEQLKKYLPVFALFKADRPSTDQDSEAQDPMRAAIKDAISGEKEKIEELTNSVKRKVMDIANLTIEKIREMNPTLARELNPRIDIQKLENIFKVSLTGDDEIPINKRGSGIRRLVLLNFFRAAAERKINDEFFHIIYGIEEPETSQHPNNQKMLIRALMELAEDPCRQVLITTHTPMFDGILPLNSLRYLEKTAKGNRYIHQGDDKTYDLITDALGVLPDNRVKLFIGVEGINDMDFLLNISDTLYKHDCSYPNLRIMMDQKKLIFLSAGGSNLQHRALNNIKPLGRPEFHLYDKDEGIKTQENNERVAAINRFENCIAILTGKREIENYIHSSVIKCEFNVEIEVNDTCDVPMLVAKALHEQDSSISWNDLDDKKQKYKESNVKKRLCNNCTKQMSMELIDEIDFTGDIKKWLRTIADIINRYDMQQVITTKKEIAIA